MRVLCCYSVEQPSSESNVKVWSNKVCEFGVDLRRRLVVADHDKDEFSLEHSVSRSNNGRQGDRP